MIVKIQLDETSQPVVYKNVVNTYTKGNLFCVYTSDDMVHKFPMTNIFRIVEDFGYHAEGSVVCKVPKSDPSCTKPPLMGDTCASGWGVKDENNVYAGIPHPSVEKEEIPIPNHDPAGILKKDDVV